MLELEQESSFPFYRYLSSVMSYNLKCIHQFPGLGKCAHHISEYNFFVAMASKGPSSWNHYRCFAQNQPGIAFTQTMTHQSDEVEQPALAGYNWLLEQEKGVTDILATEVAENMLAVIQSRHLASRLGNDRAVRTWLGTVDSIPAYQA